MKHTIEFSEDAARQVELLPARDRSIVLDAIEKQLEHQPDVPTRNRKPLRQPALARWELRVGKYRVLYNVKKSDVLVLIIAIGEKDRNVLTIEGTEVDS